MRTLLNIEESCFHSPPFSHLMVYSTSTMELLPATCGDIIEGQVPPAHHPTAGMLPVLFMAFTYQFQRDVAPDAILPQLRGSLMRVHAAERQLVFVNKDNWFGVYDRLRTQLKQRTQYVLLSDNVHFFQARRGEFLRIADFSLKAIGDDDDVGGERLHRFRAAVDALHV